jgi:uncharacterized protein YraI
VKKMTAAVLFGLLLASAGFAAAAIGSHGKFLQILTGTSSTPTMTSTTPGGRRVTICHITHGSQWSGGRHGHGHGSKLWKRFEHSITISQNAVAAHLRRGDHLGPCVTITLPPQSTTTTTSSGKHGDSDGDDDDQGSQGHGHGNGSFGRFGHGHGHGHGD